ncbi:hypothetical protein GF337_18090, partial [candidate division KSB1 bacterium]|nr:hypothetical protein [candidate division KSB1 bacterium]
MKATIIMILALLLLSVLFCASENGISPIPDNSRLSIETSREVYSWKAGGGDRYIVIEGTIENTTDTTFYSRLGDGFGSAEQNQMFFAGNSAGFLEKYDGRSPTWVES